MMITINIWLSRFVLANRSTYCGGSLSSFSYSWVPFVMLNDLLLSYLSVPSLLSPRSPLPFGSGSSDTLSLLYSPPLLSSPNRVWRRRSSYLSSKSTVEFIPFSAFLDFVFLSTLGSRAKSLLTSCSITDFIPLKFFVERANNVQFKYLFSLKSRIFWCLLNRYEQDSLIQLSCSIVVTFFYLKRAWI